MKVGMNPLNVPHARTYKMLKEVAVNVLDRIQSKPVCTCRLYVRLSPQEKALDKLIVGNTNLQYPGSPGE